MPDCVVNVKITNAAGAITTLVGTCAQAVVRDDRAFLGEPLHVGSLLPEERQRDEQGEVPNGAKCKQRTVSNDPV
jgi:chemotaxis receptor (MCP) glutamine deamidase CheD